MRKTDIDIRRRIADLIRQVVLLAAMVVALLSCGSGGSDEPGTPTPGTSTPTPIVFSAQQPEETQITRAATPLPRALPSRASSTGTGAPRLTASSA